MFKVSVLYTASPIGVLRLLESAICCEKTVKISENFLTACMTASTEACGVLKGALCFRTLRRNK